MEKDKYVFIPAAGSPTVKKLRKVTFLFIGVMTIGCGAVAIFSKPKPFDLVFIFFVYIILCLFVTVARFTTLYIAEIRIDPVEGMLYASYMNHKGEIVPSKINIKEAKYSYRLRVTRGFQGYILTMKNNKSRLRIDETQSQNKDQTNTFFRSQLDEMNQIILQIRGQLD
ncbi:hypothetical protein [Pedobacter sp. L105]|uniref:hypothetical protein n=1 Tax=Pedobacter sp. L105 TaxID=1641871 RepID=UPI00131DEFD0|nr:hypothetical protein [Pedobacter sp. L105]